MKKIIFISMVLVVLFSCNSVAGSKELAEAYYNLGNAYTELKKTKEAESAYKKALSYDKDINIAGYNLVLMYISSEEYKKALNLSKELVENETSNSFYLKLYGFSLYKNDHKEEALVQYDKVVEKDDVDLEALYNSGIINFELEKYDESLKLFNEILEIDSDYERTKYFLAKISFENDEIDKSIEYMNAFLEKKQNDFRALDLLSEMYLISKEYGKLIETYDLLIPVSKEKQGEILLKKAAIVFEVIQDNEEALAIVEKAIESKLEDKEPYLDLLKLVETLEEDVFNDLKKLLIDNELIKEGDY